jgi:biopolymer transport protein ExbD
MFRNLRFKTETAPRPHLVMRKGSQLVAKLKELASKEPTTITISADKDAPFRSVTAVMDACKEAGMRVAEEVKTP